MDVEVILHKSGTWDAENVYLSLPFSTAQSEQLWLDRGHPMRPGADQLSGTLIDFYGVQDGLAWCGNTMGVALAQRDSHLIQLGPLQYGERQLAAPPMPQSFANTYAWLMCTTWETNFAPELAGFYSFRYSLLWGPQFSDPAAALAACRDATTDLRPIRLRQREPR